MRTIERMQADNHPDLRGVFVDALFVWEERKGEETHEPCLRHGGYPAAAVVKITGPAAREAGHADAIITVDRVVWQEMTAAQKEALVDHELMHLEWDTDEESGAGKLDSQGRPKLKARRHDVQIGAFTAILERHGEASCEAGMCREVLAMAQQSSFDFGTVEKATGEMKPASRPRHKPRQIDIEDPRDLPA